MNPHLVSPSFGSASAISARTWSDAKRQYCYGFNGKETDKDFFEGAFCFEAREYDSRLQKFITTDPIDKEYPWQSTYAYYKNSPISTLDYLGMGAMPDHSDNLDPSSSTSEDSEGTENDDDESRQSSMSGSDPTRVWWFIERHKIKQKTIQDYEYTTPNDLAPNKNETIRFRVKKNATVTFTAYAVADNLIIYKRILFVFRKKVKETGFITGETNIGLSKGRYKVKVINGIGRDTGSSSFTVNIVSKASKTKDVVRHYWMGFLWIPTGDSTPHRRDKKKTYSATTKKYKKDIKSKKYYFLR